MQVVLTSYQRPKYLKQTVDSLRRDEIELYIIDGGSDDDTLYYIESIADGWIFFNNNPGADHLKTEGIKEFVTDREFILTSDDLLFPPGYSKKILEQYMALNVRYPQIDWTYCACNMAHHNIPEHAWQTINGVKMLPTDTSQVAGAIIDRALIEQVGFFPNYGKTGQGDFAVNTRLGKLGIRRCYWFEPCLLHLGGNKWIDYPELSKFYETDDREHNPHGRADDGVLTEPSNTYRIVGRHQRVGR